MTIASSCEKWQPIENPPGTFGPPPPPLGLIIMSVPLHTLYHICTYQYPCSLFTFILLLSFCYSYFFLIQAAIIQFSVIIKVRSQHAVPVPVVRQTSDRGQKIIREGSKNHQTGVKQSSGSG